MKIIKVEQGSEEWRRARAGRLTASVAADMLATRRDKKEAAPRRDLRSRLVLEQITGNPKPPGFMSEDIKRGYELEPVARRRYQVVAGELVDQVGFIQHDDLMAGASPDGIIPGDTPIDGVLEIKCRREANHLEILRESQAADRENRAPLFPDIYAPQCWHLMWITGARWVDLVSFCPSFPAHQQLVIRRLLAERFDARAYEMLVRIFLGEVDKERQEVSGATR